MKDRFYNGFKSGALAGVVSFVFLFGTRALELNTLVWTDFIGLFMLGRIPDTTPEMAFIIITQFALLGIIGAIFSLITPFILSKRLILKGALFGLTIWYITFSMPYLLQLPQLTEVPLKTAISNATGASLWGATLAYVLGKVDSKVSSFANNERAIKQTGLSKIKHSLIPVPAKKTSEKNKSEGIPLVKPIKLKSSHDKFGDDN